MLLGHVQRLLRLTNETRTTCPRQCRTRKTPEMQLGACQPQDRVDSASIVGLGLLGNVTIFIQLTMMLTT